MNIDNAVEEQLRQLKAECDLAEQLIGLSIYAPEELEKARSATAWMRRAAV